MLYALETADSSYLLFGQVGKDAIGGGGRGGRQLLQILQKHIQDYQPHQIYCLTTHCYCRTLSGIPIYQPQSTGLIQIPEIFLLNYSCPHAHTCQPPEFQNLETSRNPRVVRMRFTTMSEYSPRITRRLSECSRCVLRQCPNALRESPEGFPNFPDISP